MTASLAEMMARHAGDGRVTWIGRRAARRAEVEVLDRVMILDDGLDGDHAPKGKRAVTLLQSEHLDVIAALARRDAVNPVDLRRNLVVEGLNLLGARKAKLRVGEAVLYIEGPCPPCSRMEETLGHGGYSAVRGHGGVYASVVTPGAVALGDRVIPV